MAAVSTTATDLPIRRNTALLAGIMAVNSAVLQGARTTTTEGAR